MRIMQLNGIGICRICGCEVYPKYSKKLSEQVVKYYECGNCHFLQAERFNISRVYQSYLDKNDLGWRQRNKRILRVLDTIAKAPLFSGLGREARILDFGCGQGYMVRELRLKGYDACGYDPFMAPDDKDEPILFSNLDTLGKNQFHLVTCIEVLEHLWDPIECFEAILRTVVLKGYVLISTGIYAPNKHDCNWWYIGPQAGHVSIFSRDAMGIFLRKLNLHVVSQVSDTLFLARKNSDFVTNKVDSILRNGSDLGRLLWRGVRPFTKNSGTDISASG